jgi:CheY-like chemotaxis protein
MAQAQLFTLLCQGESRAMEESGSQGILLIEDSAEDYQDERLRTVPVVIFTTSAQPHDIDMCYRLGANSSMVKPVDFERLRHALELLMRYWFSVVILPQRRSP